MEISFIGLLIIFIGNLVLAIHNENIHSVCGWALVLIYWSKLINA